MPAKRRGRPRKSSGIDVSTPVPGSENVSKPQDFKPTKEDAEPHSSRRSARKHTRRGGDGKFYDKETGAARDVIAADTTGTLPSSDAQNPPANAAVSLADCKLAFATPKERALDEAECIEGYVEQPATGHRDMKHKADTVSEDGLKEAQQIAQVIEDQQTERPKKRIDSSSAKTTGKGRSSTLKVMCSRKNL